MDVTLLCVGDVVGSPGRHALREGLQRIRASRQIDCVIVNCENTAAGSGLTANLYDKILNYGVDLITLGDHIYKRRDIIPVLETSKIMVKPANLPQASPGKEVAFYDLAGGGRVAVISLLGRLFMRLQSNCPFAAADRLLQAMPPDVRMVVVDLHAEATSEKKAMGWYLDGRVSVLFGTHTHVPTADECVLPKGTAYITDVGMTGPYDSVLGRDKSRVVGTMVSGVPSKFDVATDDARMCGILVTVDSTSGKAKHVERVRVDLTEASQL